jgi:glucokinase
VNGKGLVAALDIGGTKLAAAIVGQDGVVFSKVVASTEPERGSANILERALDLAEIVWKGAEKSELRLSALGVATKGITKEDSVQIAGMPGWENLRIPARLRERFPGVPVTIVNDVRAATLAEMSWGTLKGVTTGLYVNLGTGFAVGVIAGGVLLRGAHDAAGEVGFMVPSRDALRDHKLGDAPLEELIAGQAIPGRVRARLGFGASMEQLVQLAQSDASAGALVAEIADDIATWVTNVALVVDPERIVIGGGFFHWGSGLLDRVEEVVRNCMPFAPAVVQARFGADSALIGAGASALSSSDDPTTSNSKGSRAREIS